MKKHGIIMNMPEGKLPGFYAQVVKALAAAVQLFDRDKEMLIVSNAEERTTVIGIMNRYKFDYNSLDLLLLPEQGGNCLLFPSFSDYGFISRSDRCYLYTDMVCVFRFLDNLPDNAEPNQAILQMEEHLLAKFIENGNQYFVADAQFEELMHKIAAAYGCSLQ